MSHSFARRHTYYPPRTAPTGRWLRSVRLVLSVSMNVADYESPFSAHHLLFGSTLARRSSLSQTLYATPSFLRSHYPTSPGPRDALDSALTGGAVMTGGVSILAAIMLSATLLLIGVFAYLVYRVVRYRRVMRGNPPPIDTSDADFYALTDEDDVELAPMDGVTANV